MRAPRPRKAPPNPYVVVAPSLCRGLTVYYIGGEFRGAYY